MADLTTSTTFQDRMFERVKESLSELLTPEEAKEWLAEHHEEVTAAITEALKDGIVALVVSRFKSEMREPMYALNAQVQQVINKLGGI